MIEISFSYNIKVLIINNENVDIRKAQKYSILKVPIELYFARSVVGILISINKTLFICIYRNNTNTFTLVYHLEY
jgi:hypothetical protein